MTEPRSLDVTVPLESERVAESVVKALAVETDGAPPRTSVKVFRHGTDLHLEIRAEDTRSLRAGMNSFLRWVDTSVAVARTALGGESFKPKP